MENSEKRKKIAEVLFPDVEQNINDIYNKYPSRKLPQGAMVTRIAPSPTGFMHIGGLYVALISKMLAQQSEGIFFLRIEDTDKKREVSGATELIVETLSKYGIGLDEGEIILGREVGNYGPYKQSERRDIYRVFIKKLVSEGKAYPCFATQEELEVSKKVQLEQKIQPGYYGKWAIWRDRNPDRALEMINRGYKPVIRLKSNGNITNSIHVEDMFRGGLDLIENNQDIVILKSEGLPTYHFAHIVDDHLMGTTNVIRGDEWISSLTLHLQLFDVMGWKSPVYGHIAPIQKLEGNSRRKLSKRLDPEASMSFYEQNGFPEEAVISYLLNLANASFEEWLCSHEKETPLNYRLLVNELKRGGGALLDLQKLTNISKDFIGRLSDSEVLNLGLVWSKKFDPELALAMATDREYTLKILGVDKSEGKTRKDITKWSDLRHQIGFFFDTVFDGVHIEVGEFSEISKGDALEIIKKVIVIYDTVDTKEIWLQKMREVGVSLGYAPDVRTYKKSPKEYKGHFGSVAKVVRVMLVGRNQSPDLYEIMRVMGKDRITKRLSKEVIFR